MQSFCFGNHHSKLVNGAGAIGAHSTPLQPREASARSTQEEEEEDKSVLLVQHLKVFPGWLANLKPPWHKTTKFYPPHKFVQGLGVF